LDSVNVVIWSDSLPPLLFCKETLNEGILDPVPRSSKLFQADNPNSGKDMNFGQFFMASPKTAPCWSETVDSESLALGLP
jgi:hypothetical protein